MKRDEVPNEHRDDDWLASTMRQATTSASDACADAETLAAWVAGGLPGQAAAAVELHASRCSRCMATLAAMERSAAGPAAGAAWTPARLFRWLAPLAAAATAVAIWIAVPDRPVAQLEPAVAHDVTLPQPSRVPPRRGATAPEPAAVSPESGTQTLEPRVQVAPSARLEEPAAPELMRDEARRDRAAQEAPGAATGTPRTPAPPAATPATPTADATSAQTLNELAAVAPERRAFAAAAAASVTSEAISPVNQLVRWRVVDSTAVERSVDGGRTWTRTARIAEVGTGKPDSLSIRGIRAVNDVTAIARTADGRDFTTSDGGRSWTPAVQEKPAAPF
jgi:hypothetical protein